MKTSFLFLCLLSFCFTLLAQRLAPLPDSLKSLVNLYQGLPSKHIFAPTDTTEAGQKLILMVEVWGRDCDCPLPYAEIFMTQTSAAGVYDLSKAGDWTSARLKGTIQTDAQGRYLIKSILPGSYPNSATANPHIHLMIEALDQPYYNILFAPYLNEDGKRTLKQKSDQHFAAAIWQDTHGQLIGFVRIYVKQ